VYHVRFGTYDRVPALESEAAGTAVLAALHHHHARTAEILTFCVMPDHVHLLVSFRVEGTTLSRWVGDLKRWLARQLRVKWQPGFYEHVVRKDEDLRVIAEYILANPVRAGLAADWRQHRRAGSLAWDL